MTTCRAKRKQKFATLSSLLLLTVKTYSKERLGIINT